MGNYKDKLMATVSLAKSMHAAGHRGVMMAEVQHDNWCRLLKGRGECNCNPEIVMKPAPSLRRSYQ
jgi:hypothetical protein